MVLDYDVIQRTLQQRSDLSLWKYVIYRTGVMLARINVFIKIMHSNMTELATKLALLDFEGHK